MKTVAYVMMVYFSALFLGALIGLGIFGEATAALVLLSILGSVLAGWLGYYVQEDN